MFKVAAQLTAGRSFRQTSTVNFKGPFSVEANSAHNVHIEYTGPLDGELSIHYGPCEMDRVEATHHCLGRTHVGGHPLARRHADYAENRPTRFVWLTPESMPDAYCLHAFSEDVPVGVSEPIMVTKRQNRRGAAFADIADAMGPWFDGVEYLRQKEPDDVFVAQVKSKKFGIIGGGMSGLMTSHLLESVGIHDWTILESSGRVGGRVHTSYLNGTAPEDYQYQEMGPMRFPVSIEYAGTNESLEIQDHKMVFQLADTLNAIHGIGSDLAVKFIPWIQSNPNVPGATSKRRPDGTVPSRGEIADDPQLQDDPTLSYSNATEVAAASEIVEDFIDLSEEKIRLTATNIFQAHKQAIEDGLFDFSESEYLRFIMHRTLNISDQAASLADVGPMWFYDSVYFSATTWRTIDKGLSSLPRAFEPLVLPRTKLHTRVDGLRWDNTTRQITITHRPTSDPFAPASTSTFDHAIIAVPFTRARLWRLPPYSSLLTRAIQTLNYQPSCKLALHFSTRFWEHLPSPILGGCGATDIPGLGSICYPSYTLNATGPGVLLASYSSGTPARSLSSMTEAEHLAWALRAVAEIHGPVAMDSYTGNYDRVCWELDPHEGGAWAAPLAGQQHLFLPAYWQTEFGTVFVGEHTSFTHAWIFSALESAVRGTAQLLLDLGLVDEARGVTREWMARWVSV
ncbi:hypothetical protein M501DRAFT_1007495 [Patellaria atrata CBS 101060]|uniref:Amine oxidase domain-containing protein n=1 Tax=Patellaria atrata CBS 101060 TaxID=1346257 RepID=A0A9P4S5H9_9PEZI|nr:hypothetical protein M501DRAFT_1007495 [Patellaria atrata CBS 101060]